VDKPVFSSYSDWIDREIGSYTLEEFLTEKLCAVIGRTHQVKELPHLEQVLREPKRKLKEHGLLEFQV
jgi:hypothetical protein